ncbi:hypothetical protein NC653_031609 [Populus alba x Populus x berolinensis]|uniref:Uncharacterized protein n=1 Tax=Populus alba x Populus x berolinensis TaxID=444605 RepID=A0AAD6Q1V7_9ROSI|nr:hypothetical protein NC653_031609 [Populus alba x Populus x berolinensis]
MLLSNPQSMIMMSSPQPTVALLFPVPLGGAASFAEFRGLRIQMGSKFSTSLVSINTRCASEGMSRCSLLSRNELDKAGWNRDHISQMGFKELETGSEI